MTSTKTYDLIVIGGGILGAAVARDAAIRGYSVALVEKGHFARGASTKTSKLAHGGLRYLEQFEFALVRESVHERDMLLNHAPERVKPLPFIVPVYKTSRRPLWQLRIGLWLYGLFSHTPLLPHPKIISKKEVLACCPGLVQDGLIGGARYYDAQMDDEGLVYDNIEDAIRYGAQCFPYHDVTSFLIEEGCIIGVSGLSQSGTFTLKGRHVLNATGAWSNQLVSLENPAAPPVVRPSKGVHIVVSPLLSTDALTITTPQDGRVFFIMPYYGHSLIGTTESDFPGNPDNLEVTPEDVSYLLQAATHYFPNSGLTPADILWSFSGLRPLALSPAEQASQASRELQLTCSPQGLWTVVGGKYTTHRAIAEQVLNTVFQEHRSVTKTVPLPTTRPSLWDAVSRNEHFLSVAHRGFCATSNCVENTLPAFEKAIHYGASMIECDLQLSKSGSIFIFHDDEGGRLLTSNPLLRALSDAEIKKLTFKQDLQCKIPFLEELLVLGKTNIYYYLELKTDERTSLSPEETQPFSEKVTLFEKSHAIVSQHGLENYCYYAAFSAELLDHIAAANPQVLLAWNLADRQLFEAWKDKLKTRVRFLCPDKSLFNTEELNQLIQEGWKIVPYTFKNPEDLLPFQTVPLTGMTADNLFLLKGDFLSKMTK